MQRRPRRLCDLNCGWHGYSSRSPVLHWVGCRRTGGRALTNWLPESAEFLKPAFGAGDPGGIDAIGGAQLGDCFGEIVADGAFGEVQLGGNLGAASAVAS